MPEIAVHENFTRTISHGPPSARSFGLVFTGVFGILALLPLAAGRPPRLWALGAALLFLIVSIGRPSLLDGLNRLWLAFGLLLARVTNPLVLALMFALVFAPIGLLIRAFKRDPLRLKRSSRDSYWLLRQPPGPRPESFTNQF